MSTVVQALVLHFYILRKAYLWWLQFLQVLVTLKSFLTSHESYLTNCLSAPLVHCIQEYNVYKCYHGSIKLCIIMSRNNEVKTIVKCRLVTSHLFTAFWILVFSIPVYYISDLDYVNFCWIEREHNDQLGLKWCSFMIYLMTVT